MKKEIRIGLIGVGSMGRTHAFAIRSLPFYCKDLPFRATLAGVAAGHPENARHAAEEWDVPFAAENENELIESANIDVIDICTPNVFHFEAVQKALLAGKSVYCEKPLCGDPKMAAKLCELSAGRTCGVVFNNRFLPAVLRAKSLIDEGALGRILEFSFSYLHDSAADAQKPMGWKQTAVICGEGGVLFDLGSHIIDLALFLCGPICAVTGKSQIAFPKRLGPDKKETKTDAPEAFYLTVRTKEGAYGTLTASKLATGTQDDLSFRISGTKGALSFSLMNPNVLSFYDATASTGAFGGLAGFTGIATGGRYPAPDGAFPSPKAPLGWLRGHVMSYASFLRTVSREKAEFHPDFSDALRVEEVMAAALCSDKNGREETIL